jgi:hypothetical protein
VDHPQFVITKSPPQQPTTYSVTHITDNRHLAEVLDVSASAKVGFTDDDFNLGASGEKERYSKAVTDDSYERFVVKWTQRGEFWRLNTPTDAILPELTSQVLIPGSDQARADFRERCGDKFINSVNVGATIYIVFTLDTKKYDAQTRQSKKGTLGLVIGEIFNGALAGSISSSNAQILSEMNVRVHADQVGGPPGLAASINATNFNTKYNEFIQGSNLSNWSAVDFTTSNYQRPTVYNAYPHEQIFADFTVPFAQARRWLDITVQQRERCDPYSANSRDTPPQCGTAATELPIALDLCRETRDWTLCQHPASYYTAFSTIGGTYLLDRHGGEHADVQPSRAQGHAGRQRLDLPAALDVLRQQIPRQWRGHQQRVQLRSARVRQSEGQWPHPCAEQLRPVREHPGAVEDRRLPGRQHSGPRLHDEDRGLLRQQRSFCRRSVILAR